MNTNRKSNKNHPNNAQLVTHVNLPLAMRFTYLCTENGTTASAVIRDLVQSYCEE